MSAVPGLPLPGLRCFCCRACSAAAAAGGKGIAPRGTAQMRRQLRWGYGLPACAHGLGLLDAAQPLLGLCTRALLFLIALGKS